LPPEKDCPGANSQPCSRPSSRRLFLQAASATCLAWPALSQAELTIRRLGIFSLLGNSVRVVARTLEEVMFKDVGMDKLVFDTARAKVFERHREALVTDHTAPQQVSVDQQLEIGNAAARRGDLPAWIQEQAQTLQMSHVLLVNSNQGAMEFKTGMSEVVGNNRVTGIGFFVSASGRVTNTRTGAVSSGYLAPFVQLRVTLLDMNSRKVVHSAQLSEGFIVGPQENEAPDPWRNLDREGKARALQALIGPNVARGVEATLTAG
jgi:hypothetical protein